MEVRFGGSDNCIGQLTSLNCIEHTLCQQLGNAEIESWKIQFFQSGNEFGAQEVHANLFDHFSERLIVKFYFLYVEMRRTQIFDVTHNGLRIGNACDPSEQAIQVLGKRGVPREIAKTHSSARSEDAGEFPGGIGLIGERAEGTFANHSIEGGIWKG